MQDLWGPAGQGDQVPEQVELSMGQLIAEVERAGGLHELQVQRGVGSGQHDAQPRPACDQVVRAGRRCPVTDSQLMNR